MKNTHYWTPTTTTARRPTVLVDVDGPLCAFDKAAVTIVNRITGKHYTVDDIETWEIFESIEKDNPDIKNLVYNEIKARGSILGFEVQGDAKEGIEKLRKVCELVIVTSPFWGSETWVHERDQWLYDHFKIKHHDVIHARKKHHVAGDFLIDDKLDNLKQWSSRFPGGTPLLWSRPSNRHDAGFPRVSTWDEVIAMMSPVAASADRLLP